MSVLQPAVIERLISELDRLLSRAKVKLNGEYVDYQIYKTIKDGNILRKYLYLETETGSIEEAQLLSDSNEVMAIKPFSITKEEDGLVLAFEFTVNVEG